MEAILALEDGRLFKGRGYGARTERGGEVVFNTSITGYQEIFTDPSYAGQQGENRLHPASLPSNPRARYSSPFVCSIIPKRSSGQ